MNKEIEIKIQISTEQLKALQYWLDANAKFVEKIYDLLRKIKITKFKKQIRGGGEMEEVCL